MAKSDCVMVTPHIYTFGTIQSYLINMYIVYCISYKMYTWMWYVFTSVCVCLIYSSSCEQNLSVRKCVHPSDTLLWTPHFLSSVFCIRCHFLRHFPLLGTLLFSNGIEGIWDHFVPCCIDVTFVVLSRKLWNNVIANRAYELYHKIRVIIRQNVAKKYYILKQFHKD